MLGSRPVGVRFAEGDISTGCQAVSREQGGTLDLLETT